MDLNKLADVAKKVPSDASYARTVFLSWLHGEIGEEERDRLLAGHTASTLAEHVCIVPRPQEQPVRRYVEARLADREPYEAGLAKLNGVWVYTTNKILQKNVQELDHVTWAMELCKQNGMENQVRLCEQHLQKNIVASQNIWQEFEKAIRVQAKDADEKRWSSNR